MLSESSTGYVINWKMYSPREDKESGKKTTLSDIVTNLLEGLEDEEYKVYMDRFYSSCNLFKSLADLKFGCCGTIQRNRLGLKKDQLKKIEKMNKYDTIFYFAEPCLLLSVWKDHKTVYCLSNFHTKTLTQKERNKRKQDRAISISGKQSEIVHLPQTINDYNSFMGGVDTIDQLCANYVPKLKSRRWYLKIFFYLVEIAIINSYLLYKQTISKVTKKFLSHLEYRKDIVRSLTAKARINNFVFSTPKKKISIPDSDQKSSSVNTNNNSEIIGDGMSPKKRSLEFECNLDDIPQLYARADTRMVCQVCIFNQSLKNKTGTSKQTRYWCSYHKVPVCFLKCYDFHIRQSLGQSQGLIG